MSRWQRLASVALLGAAGFVVGAAASLALSSASLGAAAAATPRCTNAGLTAFQNLTVSSVTSVTVGAIPAACGNATLQVTVNNGLTSSSGSAAVPAGGGSVVVTLAAAVLVTLAEETDLVLVGP